MGFGDKFKDLAAKAQHAAVEHKDQIAGAVDKAAVIADKRTKHKYTDKINKFGQKAEGAVEKLGGETPSDAAPTDDATTGAPAAATPPAATPPAAAPAPPPATSAAAPASSGDLPEWDD